MNSNIVKSTADITQCSNNGQHPLVYISLSSGTGKCQYCGQRFVKCTPILLEKLAA